MWQIDWMINLLPTWVFQFITLTGIVLLAGSRFLKSIPFFSQYNLPAYLVGIVITTLGVYYGGVRSGDAAWQDKIKAMQEQVKVAENKSQSVNTVIQTQVVEKVKVVKERVYVNKQINANTVAQQVDSKCIVPESAVVLINSASQNEVARGAGSTDGRASDVRASEVIETVVENYGRYNELREKVIAWQRWYLEQKKIFDEANR
jgi:Na+/glutamate symporter